VSQRSGTIPVPAAKRQERYAAPAEHLRGDGQIEGFHGRQRQRDHGMHKARS
jgi:hypothetical protein